jgi:hypothetical protein
MAHRRRRLGLTHSLLKALVFRCRVWLLKVSRSTQICVSRTYLLLLVVLSPVLAVLL